MFDDREKEDYSGELSPYRCETCEYAKIEKEEYEYGLLIVKKHCSVIDNDIDLVTCGDKPTFEILGCASHSAFKDANGIDLAMKAIDLWWSSYSPIPKKNPNKNRHGSAVSLPLHHHHIKRRIFLKYRRILEMTLTPDGRKLLNEFINEYDRDNPDKHKSQLVDNFYHIKKEGE